MDIYEKFDKATAQFEACALLREGKPVGRVVIKYGNAATAFVQIWGAPMATGRATGYGYDKGSAAVMAAIDNLTVQPDRCDEEATAAFAAIIAAAQSWDGGTRWRNVLKAAGFTIAGVI